jgi:hypothetical protein
VAEQWTEEDERELDELRRYDHLCSLGDRPMCPSVAKLRRMIALERKREEARRE